MARRSLADLRVLVTGASSGIGRSLVKELLAHQARVVAMARRQERLAQLAGEVGTEKAFRCVAGDVTAAADRRQALAVCQSEFGGLDVLVNNAGIGLIRPFSAGTEEEVRRIFEVNFFAPLELIREALPLLRGGTTPLIGNLGSGLGHRADPGKSEYCASKFAIHGFSDALRVELAKEGIDVLLVSPSTTASEFFQQATGDSGTREGTTNAMTSAAVARQIVRAMRSGRREIILSAAGKFLVWLDRLSPPLADWLVARFG
jgi:short-subunit dehydrogenase